MKTAVFISLLVLICSKFLSCSKIYLDDKFTLDRKNNSSKKLKLNGYYYLAEDRQIYDSYFFYQNGVLLNLGGSSNSNKSDFKNFENVVNAQKEINNVKEYWGLYEIVGDEIRFERYYPSSGGPKPAYIRSGKILNDTTFIITQSMRSDGSGVQSKNETYNFRKFSPKPDSTNNFIK